LGFCSWSGSTAIVVLPRPAFELVHGEVDAAVTQDPEGGLHTVFGDHPVQVPVLTASGGQELPIGARGMAIDALPHQSEEIRSALFKAST
jgi:hypothetical protein